MILSPEEVKELEKKKDYDLDNYMYNLKEILESFEKASLSPSLVFRKKLLGWNGFLILNYTWKSIDLQSSYKTIGPKCVFWK